MRGPLHPLTSGPLLVEVQEVGLVTKAQAGLKGIFPR